MFNKLLPKEEQYFEDFKELIKHIQEMARVTNDSHVPFWVVISCHAAIALGTLSGGWRIVKTMGQKITRLRPFEGFSAETAGAITLFATAALGIPVSTTHTITGCIIGSGITKRLSAVRWKVTLKLLWAWVLTIPVSAVIAAFIYWLLLLIQASMN